MHIAWILRDNWSTFVRFSIVMVNSVCNDEDDDVFFSYFALKPLCNSLTRSCFIFIYFLYFFQFISKQARRAKHLLHMQIIIHGLLANNSLLFSKLFNDLNSSFDIRLNCNRYWTQMIINSQHHTATISHKYGFLIFNLYASKHCKNGSHLNCALALRPIM